MAGFALNRCENGSYGLLLPAGLEGLMLTGEALWSAMNFSQEVGSPLSDGVLYRWAELTNRRFLVPPCGAAGRARWRRMMVREERPAGYPSSWGNLSLIDERWLVRRGRW
jgi:hypothetical protein